MIARTAVFVALLAVPAVQAAAQTVNRPPPKQSAAPAEQPKAAPAPQPPSAGGGDDAPPYEPELLRLSEMLGALHHLRAVCGAGDAALWRDRMAQLLDAEAGASTRRARLAGAFNSGFQSYRRSYQTCTPAAQYVVRGFLAESAQLARGVAARYSN